MKIQCDVCNKEEASVFCSADEAALCTGCDHRVHHANKLASKHNRFSLLNPTNKDAPRCDVCQERRAFLFCKEDRAILCRECDISIHTANEHTRKHSRFLLTGVKLASSISHVSPVEQKQVASTSITTSKGGFTAAVTAQSTTSEGGSTSSIAEYLIETLPGWHVEDFLDSSSALQNGFCKDHNLSPFSDLEVDTNLGNFPSDDDLGIWVPQAPTQVDEQKTAGYFKETNKSQTNPKVNKRWNDHGFTVPQISPQSNKRSRSFW
ncbi:hypothetical protein ACHQM5_024777 [Ranunculus cassubicifolius]